MKYACQWDDDEAADFLDADDEEHDPLDDYADEDPGMYTVNDMIDADRRNGYRR